MAVFPHSPLSLWLDTYGDYQPQPPLRGDRKVDVAVIGGGFTGVATAHELKRADPGLNVAVLEARTVGYGASGRNGSFAMTVVGLGFGVMAMLRGKEWLQAAHRYMMKAVDGLQELVETEHLDCDLIRPGFLRAATTPAYVKRIRHDVDLMQELGFDDIYWIDGEEVQSRVQSPRYLGAMWEPRLLLINPAKLVRAERDLALKLGAQVYENTPVETVHRKAQFVITTPEGSLQAEKLVFATNAYSHLFPELKRKQIPAFTYMIATEPLAASQLKTLGWAGREGIEDARNLIHYYRLTPDNRIVIGGGPVGLTWANDLAGDSDPQSWDHLENHLGWLFPALKDIRITHRWGGPFSVTLNLSPALGFVGDERAVYSLGCIGHGVSMSHRNAKTIRDLILERKTELTDNPFLNPKVIPWPPEPLRMMAAKAIRGYLKLEDWWNERGIQG
ncbi:MAG: FAD-dependent oxidoreductase [Candidatus Neomarinimicrobiota bacterium]|nr:MAG: FAD-dependent oxidoreductase [Candidatus Neomarinimicrobiota bacterium]